MKWFRLRGKSNCRRLEEFSLRIASQPELFGLSFICDWIFGLIFRLKKEILTWDQRSHWTLPVKNLYKLVLISIVSCEKYLWPSLLKSPTKWLHPILIVCWAVGTSFVDLSMLRAGYRWDVVPYGTTQSPKDLLECITATTGFGFVVSPLPISNSYHLYR